LLRFRGWLIEYLGEHEATIDASNLTVRDILGMLDKGDGEILRAVDQKGLFISVNSRIVYDLATQLSNNDLVTLFPIGTGGYTF
jgi:molybdopterin converting factor small subunit